MLRYFWIGLVFLGGAVCLPAASLAQQFTFDSPALSEKTTVSFSLAESDEQVEVNGDLDFSRSTSRRTGAATLVYQNFVLGVRSRSEASDVEVHSRSDDPAVATAISKLQSEAASESGFVGWHFRDLFTSSEDILTFLVGGGSFQEKKLRSDHVNFIDATEETNVKIIRQYAVIFRFPWLLFAYSRADVELDYSLLDRFTRTEVDDRFLFSFTVKTLGLKLFDGIFSVDYERRDNPGAQGQTLEMKSVAQIYRSAALDFGVFAIKGSRFTSELDLTDFLTTEQTDDSLELKFALQENLSLTLKNTRSTKTEVVLYTATPVIFESSGERFEINFTFEITFD